MKALSVIVPMLNEERAIARTLDAIAAGASGASFIVEVIVVDGGSADRSRDEARPRCATLLVAPRSLARQMNAGAVAAKGDAMVFVHADTLVPPGFASDIAAALADPAVVGGRFDVRLDDEAPLLQLIGWLISTRSRLSRTGTGDQAIFVRREIFERLGGYRDIALCEDLDLARRPRRLPAFSRHHFGAAMARARRAGHHPPDVVHPRRIFARGLARAPGPPLQPRRVSRK
jgi:glycosyltransferase involved in cell wall biosynthesis